MGNWTNLWVGCLCAVAIATPVLAFQDIYLDFDTIEMDGGPTPMGEIYSYSPAERTAIIGDLSDVFSPYGVSFFDGLPPMPFGSALITLNSGSGAFSEGIDFRNDDVDDTAEVNALGALNGTLGGSFGTSMEPLVVQATTNFIAHETEHLLGARHHDSFEPIGTGIGVGPGSFSPAYPGPSGAAGSGETFSSLATSLGLTLGSATTPKVISERAAVKMFIQKDGPGTFVTPETAGFHNAVSDPQLVEMFGFVMDYPFRPDPPPAPFLAGSVGIVTGEIGMGTTGAESDYYIFDAIAGLPYTIEIYSADMERLDTKADLALFIIDPMTGGVISDYYGSPAVNDDGLGTLDPMIIDLYFPETKPYIIEVANPFGGFGMKMLTEPDFGEYELLIYGAAQFVPEPTSAALLGLAGVAVLAGGRRRRRSA